MIISLRTKLVVGVLSTMVLIILVNTVFTYISFEKFSENSKVSTDVLSENVKKDVSGFSGHYGGTLTFHELENALELIDHMLLNVSAQLKTISQFNDLYFLICSTKAQTNKIVCAFLSFVHPR